MQEARRQRLSAARAAFEMGIPLNELNRLLDLGIKPFPWGDTPYVPSSLQPIASSTLLAAPKSDEGGLAAPKSDKGGSRT